MTDINYIKVGSTLIPLGKIQRYEDNKTAQLSVITFPIADSSETEAVDTLGVAQYINIQGRLTGDFHDLQTVMLQLKSLADGAQTAPFQLLSPFVSAPSSISGSSSGYNTYNYVRGNIGYNTTATASKLIDSNAEFQTFGTVVGDKVKNMLTGVVATVVSIDSQTQLTISSDIFTATNTGYALTATIYAKMMSVNPRWEMPGINYVEYSMALVQVTGT